MCETIPISVRGSFIVLAPRPLRLRLRKSFRRVSTREGKSGRKLISHEPDEGHHGRKASTNDGDVRLGIGPEEARSDFSEAVGVVGYVFKRMQLEILTLYGRTLFSHCLREEFFLAESCKMPREKMALSAIFFLKCSGSFHTTGNGRSRIIASVTMLGMEIAMAKISGSRQWPPG